MPIRVARDLISIPKPRRVPFKVVYEFLESQSWLKTSAFSREDGSVLHGFRHRTVSRSDAYITVEVIDGSTENETFRGTVDPDDFNEIMSFVLQDGSMK